MNTLVIGNGFDIEHGLPTKYMDFLNYLTLAREIYIKCDDKNIFEENESVAKESLIRASNLLDGDDKLSQPLKQFFQENIAKEKNVHKCFSKNILNLISQKNGKKNTWYDYFEYVVRENQIKGENWIDFEAEISNVVRRLEENEGDSRFKSEVGVPGIILFMKNKVELVDDLKEKFISKIEKDLSLFINCIDDYFKLVDTFPVKYKSPSIENILVSEDKTVIEDITVNTVNKVVNFNYTDTFRRLYKKLDSKNIHFIHGKAGENNLGMTSNLVLGCDDTLSNDEVDKNLACIKFKKYYQRIYKKTGMNYKNFMKTDDQKNLYFFGHSLAATDADVIKELIDGYDTVTVFYHDDLQHREQVVNLARILGKDKLIGYATSKLDFVQQEERIELDSPINREASL